MSLAVRLNLILTLLLLIVFYVAAAVAGNNIQRVILKQVSETSDTTLALISNIVTNQRIDEKTKQQLLIHLSAMTNTESLHIEHYSESGHTKFTASADNNGSSREAPAWFSDLISLETPPYFTTLLPETPGGTIQIGIDPTDKIDEAWNNTKPFLWLALLFVVLCYLLVFLSVRSALKPVISIVDSLDRIEKGDYNTRIPHFKSPDLMHISDKINGVAETLDKASRLEHTMAQRAVKMQEKERQYLARELHDELGQSISAIKAIAVSMDCDSNNQNNTGRKTIENLCDHVYSVVNSMMRRLRPVVLEELGLVLALRQMVDEWNDKQSEVFCKLSIKGQLDFISDDSAIHLFRVVQEGLTNISKHSNASEVDISLDENSPDRAMTLQIRDNGTSIQRENSESRFGLRGIRERIHALGGSVIIESPQTGGFSIHCKIPKDSGGVTPDYE